MSKWVAPAYLLAAVLVLAGWWFAINWKFQMLHEEIEGVKHRQDNFVQALDNTYNLLQEHIRQMQGNQQKNIPWTPTPKNDR